MPRKNRIIYEGAIYHIYQRGNNKEFIFQENKIKLFILKCIKEYSKRFDYEILAYAIMDNHYHLLIKTNKSPINEIMFHINNSLGKYINNILDRTGHAFEDRYKSKLVETDAYLIWLLRYIHRNPVKAHICNNVEEYKWSSNYFYEQYTNSFINAAFVLNMLGNNKESAIERYHILVNSIGDENDINKDYEIIKEIFIPNEMVLSSENLYKKNFIKENRKSIDEIIRINNIPEDILEDIKKGKKTPCLTSIKLRIVEKAMEESYSLKEISEYLNVGPSAISKLLSRKKII